MSTPAQKPSIGAISAAQSTSEAAKKRRRNRRGYEAEERSVLARAREQLVLMADALAEAPRDMPDSTTLREAYDAAMRCVARGEWATAREHLFALSVQAAGWCARIDLAAAREADPIPCRGCGGPVEYSGTGRVSQKCEDCK